MSGWARTRKMRESLAIVIQQRLQEDADQASPRRLIDDMVECRNLHKSLDAAGLVRRQMQAEGYTEAEIVETIKAGISGKRKSPIEDAWDDLIGR